MGRLKEQSPDPETKIRYTIDLTKGYHNLLQKEEAGNSCYYFQDELGSPVRLINEEGTLRETHGYDEFGQDLYGNQGEIQPFGYTGYQSDRITGIYYAQAREYCSELGRFAGVDENKGFIICPQTLYSYTYCFNNPYKYLDMDGNWITIAIGVAVGAVCGFAGGLVSELTDDTPGVNWKNVWTDTGTGAGVTNYSIKTSLNADWINQQLDDCNLD